MFLFTRGQKVFVEGYGHGEVCGFEDAGKRIRIMFDSKLWTVVSVPAENVEPIATSIFPVGSKVRSKYSFTGTVTGYEPDTNRLICISDKIGSYQPTSMHSNPDRTRFAYKLCELQRPKAVTFKINKIYKAVFVHGDELKVRPLPSPNNGKEVYLYDANNGRFIMQISKTVNLDNNPYGIAAIID